MSDQIKTAHGKDDSGTSRSALKRKYPHGILDSWSKEPDDGKTRLEFNDMCDHVIDEILSNLELLDLANISDTSIRLRGIAASVFSRKHAHRLISIDTLHYSLTLSDRMREFHTQYHPVQCKHDSIVRISDAKIWFKLMRNFGASLKHIRIYSLDSRYGTKILVALQNLTKYVSEFCSDSLETLDVDGYRFLNLTKPLTRLTEFCFFSDLYEISEAFELMQNVRTLKSRCVPKTMAKHFAKLERADCQMRSYGEVQTFISFLRLNRQIKYLSLCIAIKCEPEDILSIYSLIANNLPQLKTLKLYDTSRQEVYPHYDFKTVETFSINIKEYSSFHFSNLKKLKLMGTGLDPWHVINFVLRYKKLQILKLDALHETILNNFKRFLNELPELEQIIVYSCETNRYSILKDLLGVEWEQFEKERTDRFRTGWPPQFQRFRKIKSVI